MTEDVAPEAPEAPPQKTLWALLDKGVYKGGIAKLGDEPPTKEENPDSWEAVQIERFPCAGETWNKQHGGWVIDEDARTKIERVATLRGATREEFAELILAEAQQWVLRILPELLPDLKLTQEQIKTLFPLARDN